MPNLIFFMIMMKFASFIRSKWQTVHGLRIHACHDFQLDWFLLSPGGFLIDFFVFALAAQNNVVKSSSKRKFLGFFRDVKVADFQQ